MSAQTTRANSNTRWFDMLAPQRTHASADMDPLLAPISERAPCGDDLLFSTDFDAIQEARRYDDPTLEQGDWVTTLKEADWSFVAERCTALLGGRTKDLRLAVWLTEALSVQEGLPGLIRGYAVLTGLVERYWTEVHPLPDGNDMESRLGNVGWLAGRTAELLRTVPITRSDMAFSTLDWDIAVHAAQAAKRDPENAHDILRNKPTVEQIDLSKRATKPEFYRELLSELKSFESALNALDGALEAKAGEAAPSLRQARNAYDYIYLLVERFARDVGVDPQTEHKTTAAAAVTPERVEPTFQASEPGETHKHVESHVGTQQHLSAHTAAAGIQTRARAIAQLREVAEFFRKTEPHSPAAYLAEKAAEWADMPLHQWLSVVVKDDGVLSHVRELLGVKSDGSN